MSGCVKRVCKRYWFSDDWLLPRWAVCGRQSFQRICHQLHWTVHQHPPADSSPVAGPLRHQQIGCLIPPYARCSADWYCYPERLPLQCKYFSLCVAWWCRGVASELESPGVLVMAQGQSQSLPFQGYSESGRILLLYCTLSLVVRSFGRCTVHAGLKSCLYTIVHLLLEEFIIHLKSSFSTRLVCRTISLGMELE